MLFDFLMFADQNHRPTGEVLTLAVRAQLDVTAQHQQFQAEQDRRWDPSGWAVDEPTP